MRIVNNPDVAVFDFKRILAGSEEYKRYLIHHIPKRSLKRLLIKAKTFLMLVQIFQKPVGITIKKRSGVQ